MGTYYEEFDTIQGTLLADIKQKILASSDWAHLQLTTGTQATTLASGASAGATSISTVATIPSGSYVVIGHGAATPEVRLTTGVTGSGPYTVSFAAPLVNGYSSGAAVGVGTYCKATTTRGAQMVVDLADAAPSVSRMQLAFYRTHDGTTAVDKFGPRYISYQSSAASHVMHVKVSAGKEHLYVEVEGPRWNETGTPDGTHGGCRQFFGIFDLVPYHASDLTPAVVVVSYRDQRVDTTIYEDVGYVFVSRNQDNTASWVPARVYTLKNPAYGGATGAFNNRPMRAKGDGKDYLAPYTIWESKDGLRGRLNKVYEAGVTYGNRTDDVGPLPGTHITYSSEGYKLICPSKGGNNYNTYSALGFAPNNVPGPTTVGVGLIIAIPDAA